MFVAVVPAKRGRGRPKGSRNKPKPLAVSRDVEPAPVESERTPAPLPSPTGSTRATLEADRDRLLKGIASCQPHDACEKCGINPNGLNTDWKTVAALQGQLNGVNRMLLRITGETAPTDANLIRSPQWSRLKADLIAALRKHPKALADVVRVFDTAEQ